MPMEVAPRRGLSSAIPLMDVIHGRRSVRDYASKPVSREMLKSLVDAATQAPSAMNEQPWLFNIVTERKLLDRIADEAKAFMREAIKDDPLSAHAGALLRGDDFHIFYHAPALIVISAPLNERWRVENCALAAQNLMLAAYAAGLGSCWIGFAQSWLGTHEGKREIGVPESFLPVAPIIVGHPKSAASPVPRKPPRIVWCE